jgi:hypothetical protein
MTCLIFHSRGSSSHDAASLLTARYLLRIHRTISHSILRKHRSMKTLVTVAVFSRWMLPWAAALLTFDDDEECIIIIRLAPSHPTASSAAQQLLERYTDRFRGIRRANVVPGSTHPSPNCRFDRHCNRPVWVANMQTLQVNVEF